MGTGLRASVMVHVPALVRTRKIQRLIQSMLKCGFFRSRLVHGEGTDMAGNILQISNQVTLGAEEDVVARLQSLGEQLAKEERAAREQAERDPGADGRSSRRLRRFALCPFAQRRRLTLFSTVELGRILGIIPHMSADAFREMLVTTRPGLQRYAHSEEQDVQTRDTLRAAVVRDSLQKMEKENTMDNKFTQRHGRPWPMRRIWRNAATPRKSSGREHLLAGIASEEKSLGGKVLHEIGMTAQAIEARLGIDETSPVAEQIVPMSPRTKRYSVGGDGSKSSRAHLCRHGAFPARYFA